MTQSYRERQEAQLAAWQAWVQEQGKDGQPPPELPVQIDTLLQRHQQRRMAWLKANTIGTVLEVGCSWGYALAYVDGQTGVDLNRGNIELARLLAPHRRFITADARALPFFEGEFETVMLPEILEHLTWPESVQQALGEAARVASKRVLITLPSPDSPESGSKKHAWVANKHYVSRMMTFLQGCSRNNGSWVNSLTSAFGFICIRLEKQP